MDNLYYAFGGNSGYKIHLPVLPDINDPLTKKIAAYLDTLYGTTEADRHGFRDMGAGRQGCFSRYFKIGNCSDALEDGKGITIYGKETTADEMRKLAQDIEAKFGKEIAAVKVKHNIGTSFNDTPVTAVVTGRFNGNVQKGKGNNAVPILSFRCKDSGYNQNCNPSGAPTVPEYRNIKGQLRDSSIDVMNWKSLSDIDKKFCWGASTMETINHYGELFTGKIENGKVPPFIMDGLPKEYLQHYNLTEADIILKINNGTKLFVANMLEDIVNTPNSQAFRKAPWMATLNPELIDGAKQLLAQHEPQTVQKLEQMLPQLEQQCPSLAILKQTTPFSQMKITPAPNPINPTGTENPVNPTPKPQPKPKSNTNVGENAAKVGWFEKLGTKGKIGLAVAGTALVAGIIYALAHHSAPKKDEIKTDTPQTQLNQQSQTIKPYQQITYNNYYGNPYKNYSMNEFMRV